MAVSYSRRMNSADLTSFTRPDLSDNFLSNNELTSWEVNLRAIIEFEILFGKRNYLLEYELSEQTDTLISRMMTNFPPLLVWTIQLSGSQSTVSFIFPLHFRCFKILLLTDFVEVLLCCSCNRPSVKRRHRRNFVKSVIKVSKEKKANILRLIPSHEQKRSTCSFLLCFAGLICWMGPSTRRQHRTSSDFVIRNRSTLSWRLSGKFRRHNYLVTG